MKLKPEILCNPNVPKPLHGLAPRTIMGQKWWDKTRQEVYAATDYHCAACGVHKSEAKGKRWLEAHEYWKVNYTTGMCEIISIEPLCHYCHNFIHSGRLSVICGTEKNVDEVIDILEHGFEILKKNKLKCFPYTLEFARLLNCETFGVKPYIIPETNVERSDWRLLFNGKEYKGKFANEEEWSNNKWR